MDAFHRSSSRRLALTIAAAMLAVPICAAQTPAGCSGLPNADSLCSTLHRW